MSDSPETQALMVNNLNVLANAVALATRVIVNTAGNAASNTVGGELVNESFIADAVAARMQATIAPYVGGE